MNAKLSPFLANRALFASRWPQQAAFLEQKQAAVLPEDPEEMARWFSGLELNQMQALVIYGVGQGGAYARALPWLKEKEDRYLVFIEDNPDAFAGFLGQDLATQMLNDPQVVIFPFHIGEEYDWSRMANDFSWLFSFLAVMPYRLTAHPANVREDADFADRLISHLYTNLMQANRHFRESFVNQKHTYRNFYHNMILLPQAAGVGHGLFQQFKDIPAVICGAGPSLEKQLPYLRELVKGERALVFAAGTAMNILTQAGIIPHFGGAIDPHDTQESRQLTQWGFQVPFFYRNRYCYKALRLVHGPRLYITGGQGANPASWFEERLGLKNDEAIVTGMSTTNFCTEIAGAMGCNPIIFVGVDLAYTGKERYAHGVEAHAADNQSEREGIHSISPNAMIVQDVNGKEILTKWPWLFEAMCLTSFARRYPHVKVVNATEGGMPVLEIPNKKFQEVVKGLALSQGDLHTKIHETIQASPLPADCITKLGAAFEEWSQSLYRCFNLCVKLQLEIPEWAHSLSLGEAVHERAARVSQLEEELHKEPAYRYLLAKMEETYAETNFRESIRLQWHPQAYSEIDRQTKPLQWKWATVKFLGDTADYHLQVLLEALRTTLAPPKAKPGASHPSEVPLENGFRHGEIHLYHANGQMFAREHWVKGELEGIQQYYYPDGSLHAEFCYVKGAIHGDVVLNYPNGKPQRRFHMHEGKLDGVERLWDEAGQLRMECDYRKGKPCGQARWWHPDGRLAREVTYHENSPRVDIQEFS